MDVPVVDFHLQLDRNLGTVLRHRGDELLLDAAVELLADPQPGHSRSAEADGALVGIADQVTNAGFDAPVLDIDDGCHGGDYRGSASDRS